VQILQWVNAKSCPVLCNGSTIQTIDVYWSVSSLYFGAMSTNSMLTTHDSVMFELIDWGVGWSFLQFCVMLFDLMHLNACKCVGSLAFTVLTSK
jgi:hypothetical protein